MKIKALWDSLRDSLNNWIKFQAWKEDFIVLPKHADGLEAIHHLKWAWAVAKWVNELEGKQGYNQRSELYAFVRESFSPGHGMKENLTAAAFNAESQALKAQLDDLFNHTIRYDERDDSFLDSANKQAVLMSPITYEGRNVFEFLAQKPGFESILAALEAYRDGLGVESPSSTQADVALFSDNEDDDADDADEGVLGGHSLMTTLYKDISQGSDVSGSNVSRAPLRASTVMPVKKNDSSTGFSQRLAALKASESSTSLARCAPPSVRSSVPSK